MKNTNREIVKKLMKRLDEPTSTTLCYTVGDAHIEFSISNGDLFHASLFLQSDEDALIDAVRHNEWFEEKNVTLFDCNMLDVWFSTLCPGEDYLDEDLAVAILEALVNASNGQFKSLLHTTGKVHDAIFRKVSEETFCRAVEINHTEIGE